MELGGLKGEPSALPRDINYATPGKRRAPIPTTARQEGRFSPCPATSPATGTPWPLGALPSFRTCTRAPPSFLLLRRAPRLPGACSRALASLPRAAVLCRPPHPRAGHVTLCFLLRRFLTNLTWSRERRCGLWTHSFRASAAPGDTVPGRGVSPSEVSPVKRKGYSLPSFDLFTQEQIGQFKYFF